MRWKFISFYETFRILKSQFILANEEKKWNALKCFSGQYAIGFIDVKPCKWPPLILSRKDSVLLGPEVNKRPYWFMWECKRWRVIKASLYAECDSLSSLHLTIDSLNSLTICHYWSLLSVIPLDGNECFHRTDESFCWLTLVCLWVGVHWETLLMSSFLLLQQCTVGIAYLTWTVCEIGGKWLYSCCFVGYCF